MEEQMINDEMMVIDRKVVKKDVGGVAWVLILYMLINYAVVLADMVWKIAAIMLKTSDEVLQEQQIEALTESAGSMIIGVLLGVVVLSIFMSKRIDRKEMFVEKKKMTAKTFLGLLSVFMTAQLLGSLFYNVLEIGLNMIGYTAQASMEAATGASNTISMFVYASFVAPVVEELVYRGFVQESLRKYGKVFAIVVSAILFGVMHGNIPQAVFAFGVGLVLGYVAVEYSLKWAIFIHVINNFVFAELIGIAGKIFGENVEIALSSLTIYVFFFVGITILWKKRKEISVYVEEHKGEKELYRWALTALPMILFIAGSLLLGIFMLEPIG